MFLVKGPPNDTSTFRVGVTLDKFEKIDDKTKQDFALDCAVGAMNVLKAKHKDKICFSCEEFRGTRYKLIFALCKSN